MQTMSSDEMITIISNQGLRDHGGFRWAAARDEEIIVYGLGPVTGSQDQMSSYRTEATAMLSDLYIVQNITSELQSQVRLSLWSESTALVQRLSNMLEYDPISAFLRSDPDLYCGIISAAKQLNIEGIDHVKGHQDRSGRTLNNIEKLNVVADKLATRIPWKLNDTKPSAQY